LIIDQTVNSHDDLLKVVDNMLGEAGLNRADLKGKVTFAGLDPIRPTVLKVGAGGAAVVAAKAIASALIHQEKTGEGQDIHVDLRQAFANHSKWQDVLVDCCMVNGVSQMMGPSAFGEDDNMHLLPTLDGRWLMVAGCYPSQFLKQTVAFNSGFTQEQLAASSIKQTADAWEAIGNSMMVPITKVRTQEEFQASEHWPYHISTPLIHIEKVGDSAPEPFPAGERPLSGIRSLSNVHVVAGPHAQSTLAAAGADSLNIHPANWYEEAMFILQTHVGYRHAVLDPFKQRDEVYKLIKDADVYIENLRPGLADREGYSTEELAAIRPGIITGSIKLNTPGPYSQMPGYDFSAGAITGLFTETGTADQPAYPNAVNVICDLLVGSMLAVGLQAALLRRAKEGGSYKVSVSLAQGATWLMSLGLVPKSDLLDIASMGPDHQAMKPNLISGKTAFGDTAIIGSQAEMSLTPESWADPIVSLPGSSYPVWLPR
jgi:crotonobetainyl-CoA:carnitine CoA-transferase CaiB-like acyl-CoA transferase